MIYRYEVLDLEGRRWARTMTAGKAARIVIMLYQTRGLTCTIKELS